MEYEIRPATLDDAKWIAAHAREADVDEMWAVAKAHPWDCMVFGLEASHETMTGVIDGEPVCMFGVTPENYLTGAGCPWMVATEVIDDHAIPFLRRSKGVILAMLAKWNYLHNWVDARNGKAIRWLRFLGFTIHPPLPYGELGLPFHYFEMRG